MPVLELVPQTGRAPASKIVLSPTQQKAADGVLLGLQRGDCVVLQDMASDGKSTVLRFVQAQIGGTLIGVRKFLSSLASHAPLAIEEAFLDLLDTEIAKTETYLLVDDLHLLKQVVESYEYTRQHLFDAALTAILDNAASLGKKLLFAAAEIPGPLARRAHSWMIGDFTATDYAVICGASLAPAVTAQLDFEEIHRFAPSLNAHQLRKAAQWLAHEPALDTPLFLGYLSQHDLVSNVKIEEVEAVTWNDLQGVEDVIRQLEAKIALPFENHELAAALNLVPKRGVLLSGPPGTGKTTIGRALAHRLKGKFFLVDGSMIAGSGDFYREIDRVFHAATRNAPSIVFIDDADVIFSGEKEAGLYRYLLTKMDGLESASTGRICVMMTAMEPADLPAAILRSGRVELWLETRLPDDAARARIFQTRLESLPAPLCGVDIDLLSSASRGCTGADLKAVIEDGKLQFAYDHANGRLDGKVEDYFLEAIATARDHRRKHQKRSSRPLEEAFGFASKAC